MTPFKVADRLAASAWRRRYRLKSTNDSRELLFQRALELDDRVDTGVLGGAPLSLARHTAPLLRSLIAKMGQEPELALHASATEHNERGAGADKSHQCAIAGQFVGRYDEWAKEVKEFIGNKQGSSLKTPRSRAINVRESHLQVSNNLIQCGVGVPGPQK